MENCKTILLYNLTPDDLREMIVKELKIEIEAILKKRKGPENYSVQEVSKLLSCSELTVYNYIKKGTLTATKIGRKYIIKKADLDEVLKEVKSLKYQR